MTGVIRKEKNEGLKHFGLYEPLMLEGLCNGIIEKYLVAKWEKGCTLSFILHESPPLLVQLSFIWSNRLLSGYIAWTSYFSIHNAHSWVENTLGQQSAPRMFWGLTAPPRFQGINHSFLWRFLYSRETWLIRFKVLRDYK